MQLITTTDLRHKTSKLVELLQQGQSLTLIHRSKLVGTINPIASETSELNIQDFQLFLSSISPKITITEQNRKKSYQKHLKKRYG